ncbi:hypothetical protein DFH09DRAFT_1269246 [Mycena vulgaris]|nr:hypothetical protein DFH09DRAFT_1269246 [Mycena vulgaris]
MRVDIGVENLKTSDIRLLSEEAPLSVDSQAESQQAHSVTTLCNNCDHGFEHIRYPIDFALSALRHNYSPEGDEATEILRTINAIDSEFARYDPELSRVQGILASLQEQRQTLKRYQECCRSALSPIRKLPPEILQTIFLACRGPEPDVIPAAGQVCRYWRDVIVASPKLWSIISVGRTRYTFSTKYHELASLFLDRSATQPLCISIRNPADTRLVELLARHVDRWQTLRLSTTSMSFYTSLGLDTLDLGMLEKLEITGANTIAPSDADSVTISRNAPKLRDVVLKNPLKLWNLPWSQLTRIQYDVHAAADGVRIFQLCPQLVECSLDRLKEVPAENFNPVVFPSRHLRFLRLAVDTTTPTHPPESLLKTFFTHLTTPNLASLELVGQWFPVDLTGFLTRNEGKLESLTLGMGYMKDENVVSVLETLPLLKSLVLDADIGTSRQLQNRVITDNLLRRLVFYPDSDCLLPCLTHLTLRTSLNFEDQVLLDVVESRWTPWVTELYGVEVSRLTSADLHFCGKKEALDPYSIDELRDLCTAGLRITLQQGSERISLLSSDN